MGKGAAVVIARLLALFRRPSLAELPLETRLIAAAIMKART
jgi:hypothetical protein